MMLMRMLIIFLLASDGWADSLATTIIHSNPMIGLMLSSWLKYTSIKTSSFTGVFALRMLMMMMMMVMVEGQWERYSKLVVWDNFANYTVCVIQLSASRPLKGSGKYFEEE